MIAKIRQNANPQPAKVSVLVEFIFPKFFCCEVSSSNEAKNEFSDGKSAILFIPGSRTRTLPAGRSCACGLWHLSQSFLVSTVGCVRQRVQWLIDRKTQNKRRSTNTRGLASHHSSSTWFWKRRLGTENHRSEWWWHWTWTSIYFCWFEKETRLPGSSFSFPDQGSSRHTQEETKMQSIENSILFTSSGVTIRMYKVRWHL